MIYFLLVSNILTFIVFGVDKWYAKKNKRRVSELFLLSLTFLGGTLGALLAMMIFRHKISKKSFILKLLIVIFVQLIIFGIMKNFKVNF
ncbi:DUF1294 domain-containing protein [Chryseobacterium sp. CFS15]|uniref:DUF1294 domain-containing protein n=1 Tax=Chryseobacterium sp. CFS15 TaxID=2986946 RepID=UPI00280840A9|nr:DUF1294 domain-containing protein [Chryseobacterium sp. CFS15]MDQ8141659.1 DUF1294 domain-containing protein [Chryseobacterium sp. CFS15]